MLHLFYGERFTCLIILSATHTLPGQLRRNIKFCRNKCTKQQGSNEQEQLLQKTKIVQGIRGHSSTFKSDLNQFKEILGYYVNKNISGPIAFLDTVIQNYAPVAIQMDEFYCAIQDDKLTKYPDESMQRLLNELV